MRKLLKNKNVSNVKSVILAIFLVALVLFYFQHLSNKSGQRKTEEQKNELASLCGYDMETSYPKTARDVIKLHNRYLKVFYSQSLSDEELQQLNENIRYLYSEELLSYNPESESFDKLKNDITAMNKKNCTYKAYVLPEASQITYYERSGVKMATAEVKLTVSVDGTSGYMYVQYVLVNENEKWKILGWGDSTLSQSTEE